MPSQQDLYNTTTGSAVAQTLQDILARRKAESRQAILDRLGIEEQRSVASAREAQTQREREQIDIQRKNLELQRLAEERAGQLMAAQVAESKQRTFTSKAEGLPVGTKSYDIGDPEFLASLVSQGRMGPEVQPEGPAAPGEPMGESQEILPFREYPGSPQEQGIEREKLNRMQGIDEARAAMGQAISPQQEAALSAQSRGLNLQPSFFEAPTVDLPIVTAGGSVPGTVTVPRGERPVQLGFPPTSAQLTAPRTYSVMFADGGSRKLQLSGADALAMQENDPAVKTKFGITKDVTSVGAMSPAEEEKINLQAAVLNRAQEALMLYTQVKGEKASEWFTTRDSVTKLATAKV